MSDSDESGVTYMEISSTFEELSDIGSPGVVPSPDYILGPEEPQSPPPLDYIPEPIYPEYMPQEDESDTEADLEEDDDEDPEEDPVDDDEEEEEHPAPADSVVVALPAADQAPSVEETEPFEADESAATPPPHPAYRVTARISIPAPIPSQPLPPIPSPSLPVSPPPVSLIRPLGYRAAMIRLRAEAASTSYSLPLPPPIILSHTRPIAPSSGTPPLLLLSTNCREDRPESSSAAAARPVGGLRADYGFVATMDKEIRRDPERDVGYEITDSWDEIVETLQGAPVNDEQSGRQLLVGWINMLFRDRRAHAQVMSLRTTVLAQQSQIRELQSADRKRQTVITEMLSTDHMRQKQLTEALKLIKRLQTHMAEFKRQQGPAKGPARPELPEEAGSSS
ncbi:hypothetical protein Tco_1015825 [Tanacetum coccineum]|uniref:Uncharacterized protein n=1 Tax=Tanacetum coccineum TaxID=301880 RepID=A0ABQ5FM11_9ASTR